MKIDSIIDSIQAKKYVSTTRKNHRQSTIKPPDLNTPSEAESPVNTGPKAKRERKKIQIY